MCTNCTKPFKFKSGSVKTFAIFFPKNEGESVKALEAAVACWESVIRGYGTGGWRVAY